MAAWLDLKKTVPVDDSAPTPGDIKFTPSTEDFLPNRDSI
jgi:hypothetical protein